MCGLAACDALTQKDAPPAPPPFVHLIASSVGGPSQTTLPQDGIIQLVFDRYLNPLTVNRQSFGLRDSFGNAPDSPIVQYDPVTRVVTLSNPNPGVTWLQIDQPYRVVLPIATDEAGSFGLRAIDGATLDPTTEPVLFNVTAPSGTPPTSPTIDFCADVFPLFAAQRAGAPQMRGACSNAVCHAMGPATSPFVAAQGLVLETEDGIRHTAIGVEAAETTTGALSTPLAPQNAFPAGMPIIDPGDPSNSYLIYKLLLPDENGAPSATTGASLPYTPCRPMTAPFSYGPSASFASSDEAARLNAHVVGRRMPWGDYQSATNDFSLHGGTAFTLDEIERVRLWIAQGAEVDDCSACQATVP